MNFEKIKKFKKRKDLYIYVIFLFNMNDEKEREKISVDSSSPLKLAKEEFDEGYKLIEDQLKFESSEKSLSEKIISLTEKYWIATSKFNNSFDHINGINVESNLQKKKTFLCFMKSYLVN